VSAAVFLDRVRAMPDEVSVVEHAPLAPLTTFGVGGAADWLITATTIDQVCGVIAAAHDAQVPVTILGGGSNVVVADEGVRGVVLRLKLANISRPTPERVRAEAGVTMNGLVRWSIGRGLAALEA
jgi:UDP-N-acetylmuramate dehydrogenase